MALQKLPLPGSPEFRIWLLQQRRRDHKNATVPDAPVGLAAAASVDYVDVTWAAQQGFVVTLYRALSDSFGASSKILSFIDVVAYVDEDVIATTDYWYFITISNGVGESDPSDSVTVTAL